MFGLSGRQILILLMIAGLVFAGVQYIPAYVVAFQFDDFIHQEVKFAFSSRKTVEALRTDIVEKAKELEIPITRSDIHITRRGPSFKVELEYRWPIDMKIYHHELIFRTSATGEVFDNASD
jgi:hypothetical protein